MKDLAIRSMQQRGRPSTCISIAFLRLPVKKNWKFGAISSTISSSSMAAAKVILYLNISKSEETARRHRGQKRRKMKKLIISSNLNYLFMKQGMALKERMVFALVKRIGASKGIVKSLYSLLSTAYSSPCIRRSPY